ncbi:hypothetical protein [Armatimonas sp.]|nr:hypothetical protein [Armatimonas sp.]
MKLMRFTFTLSAATLAALTILSLFGTAHAQALKTQKFPDGNDQIGVAPG